MVIDEITQYILAIVPAVTALVGMIVTIGVGIGAIRKANNITSEKVDRLSAGQKAFLDQNKDLKKENAELRKALIELNQKIKVADLINTDKVNRG